MPNPCHDVAVCYSVIKAHVTFGKYNIKITQKNGQRGRTIY